ncbi:MAG: nuclear transport factor 2 family protein [Myxococcota bacterium]|nr:nuclear transport factor 2 family protein [Myxococcota bacterium]
MIDDSRPLTLERLADEREIERVLIAYATAVDTRNWPEFDAIFAPSVHAIYGNDPKSQFVCTDREAVRTMCRENLAGCGPTQHLLANFRIEVDGDAASSICSVQAGHFGRGEARSARYELWGEYRDKWARGPEGWRITHRQLHAIKDFGEPERVLGPA